MGSKTRKPVTKKRPVKKVLRGKLIQLALF